MPVRLVCHRFRLARLCATVSLRAGHWTDEAHGVPDIPVTDEDARSGAGDSEAIQEAIVAGLSLVGGQIEGPFDAVMPGLFVIRSA